MLFLEIWEFVKNNGFYHIFHHFTIDFDAGSTEKRAQNHGFCNVLQLVSPYFDLILMLFQKPSKTQGFSSISPYFDLILTLFWGYFWKSGNL